MSTVSKKRSSFSVTAAIFKASVFILLGVTVGVSAVDMRLKSQYNEEIETIKAKYREAYYITVDDSGAWLGDYPGHKFQPMYDSNGHRIGAKLDNDTVASSE